LCWFFLDTSVEFQRTARLYIPDDKTLHDHHYENLKYYEFLDYNLSDAVSVANRIFHDLNNKTDMYNQLERIMKEVVKAYKGQAR
jgi:hypothetical protein